MRVLCDPNHPLQYSIQWDECRNLVTSLLNSFPSVFFQKNMLFSYVSALDFLILIMLLYHDIIISSLCFDCFIYLIEAAADHIFINQILIQIGESVSQVISC